MAGFAVTKLNGAAATAVPKAPTEEAPAPVRPLACEPGSLSVFFAPKSADISGDDQMKLKGLVQYVKASACRVIIEGYSALKERGRRWAGERAAAVSAYFDKAGLSAGAVAVRNRGTTELFGAKDSDNRRVVITVRR